MLAAGLVRAVVFGIEEDDIDTEFGLLLLNLTGYLKKYSYTCLLYTSRCV